MWIYVMTNLYNNCFILLFVVNYSFRNNYIRIKIHHFSSPCISDIYTEDILKLLGQLAV